MPRAAAAAAAAWLVLLLAAAPSVVSAEKCGKNANGKLCSNPQHCCSIYGFCGVGSRFCAVGKCASGACDGKVVPVPSPKPDPGCPATCGVAVGEGAVANALCKQGLVITSIPKAVYGVLSKRCWALQSVSVVQRLCIGKQSCAVPATDAQFGGNPCPALPSVNLWFQYTCGPPAVTPQPQPVPKPSPKPLPKPVPSPKPVPTPSPDQRDTTGPTSSLWGQAGELWSPSSRIPDLSYSGYMANERPIPNYPVAVTVTDPEFGAKGDGIADDTNAIIAAIAKASEIAKEFTTEPCGKNNARRCALPHSGFQNEGRQGVAVYMPPGTYVITKMVEISQSNVVLRGAGPGKTILHFPKGLQKVYGNQMTWAYMGGFLVLHGRNLDSGHTEQMLASMTAAVGKGQRRIMVDSTAGISVGQWVRIYARSPTRSSVRRRLLQAQAQLNATAQPGFLPMPEAFVAGQKDAMEMGVANDVEHAPAQSGGVRTAAAAGTLDAYIYGENLATSATPYSGERIRFASRVAAIGPGWIDLERPLPYDVRMQWRPAVYAFATPLQHSGFEGFTVDFAWDVYPAHFKCGGYNGFWVYGSANTWVRKVEIINADTGAEAQSSDFVTMSGMSFNITAPRGTTATYFCDGHHGAWSCGSSNVHITDFTFYSRFIHDLTLDVFSQECVYNNGRGVDMSLDMHRSAVHNNLWSNIDVGLGTRPFLSSGQEQRGAHAGANNTWWNIYSSAGATLNVPTCDFGAQLAFVGSYGPPCARRRDCPQEPSGEARAAGLQRGYCPEMKWWTEGLAPGAGKRFVPADLFGSMAVTRRARLGK